MTIKEQWKNVKDNWLMIGVGVVVLLVMLSVVPLLLIGTLGGGMSAGVDEQFASVSSLDRGFYPSSGFAPEVEERVVIKDSSLSTEVEKGSFDSAEVQLKSIIKSSDSYLLNENVRTSGEGWRAYKTGYYQLKVDTTKYDSVLEQLKDIGEVKSFREDAQDVTGIYTDLETELETEKARLKRYQELYDSTEDISDKIELEDKIFNQEKLIKYLEDRIENIDERVDYSQIQFTLNEEKSGYADITFVKLSDIVGGVVGSTSALLMFIIYILPWFIAALIIRWGWRKARG